METLKKDISGDFDRKYLGGYLRKKKIKRAGSKKNHFVNEI